MNTKGAMLMEKQRETIVYGGAFNPPTKAHQAILQSCIEYAEPLGADVWLLPSGDRKDKTIGVNKERRLAFCEALIRDVMRRTVVVGINIIEMEREHPTETYETVLALKAKYPDRSFVWVFGSDSIATMLSWNRGDWMKSNLSMLVIDRPGAPKVEIGPNAAWLPVQADEMSSTELRRRIAASEPYDELVSPNVAAVLAG